MNTEPIETTALVVAERPDVMIRQASDAAGVCREIVLRTACNIQGRKYVKCEGWMAIATAHGCIASSRDVRKVEGGWTAIGEIRRLSDGVLLSQAEGFVGMDEKKWGNCPEYASRAMAQTRAISRACRAAFAHVVVMIDGGLSTTPAEEVPDGGFEQEPKTKGERWTAIPAGPPKTPSAAPKPPKPLETPAERRKRFLDLFVRYGDAANEVFSRHDLILPGVETIDDIHDSKIDMMNKAHVFALLEEVKMAYGGGDPPDPEPAQGEFKVNPSKDEPWRDLGTPFTYKDTPAGTPLGMLEKAQLWFWVMIFAPKRWNDKKTGELRNPSEKDVAFFEALKPHRAQIIARYKFTPPKE